jgi:hypothetical protein
MILLQKAVMLFLWGGLYHFVQSMDKMITTIKEI